MIRHAHFDLYLHEDTELEQLLGAGVATRETLAEWPLSCVQRVRLADGRTLIYKAQARPTVEPDFYAAARSPMLVAATALPNPHGPDGLLLEEIAYAPLSARQITPADATRVAGEVVAALAEALPDGLPFLADLRGEQAWARFVDALLADLTALVAAGTFRRVNGETVAIVAGSAARPDLLGALTAEPGYLHGDLTADNVFLDDRGGILVVDWQRPLWGPRALDHATLLESLGLDPCPIVGQGATSLLTLTRIAWLAACARRWFPPGAETYDRQIAGLVASLGRA